jgi:hypothetical protein
MGHKYISNHVCMITAKKNASQHNNGVIVIAHGAQLAGESFPLEGGEVWFYCPDGATLLENKYDFFRTRIKTHMVEKLVSPGNATCPNYRLHKTTTYHGGASHAAVGKKEIIRILKEDPATAEAKGYSDYEYLDKLVTNGEIAYDIASIRHRWFSDGTTFKDVMKTLKKEGYGYGEVHCYFCRSSANPKTWDVEERKYV